MDVGWVYPTLESLLTLLGAFFSGSTIVLEWDSVALNGSPPVSFGGYYRTSNIVMHDYRALVTCARAQTFGGTV